MFKMLLLLLPSFYACVRRIFTIYYFSSLTCHPRCCSCVLYISFTVVVAILRLVRVAPLSVAALAVVVVVIVINTPSTNNIHNKQQIYTTHTHTNAFIRSLLRSRVPETPNQQFDRANFIVKLFVCFITLM